MIVGLVLLAASVSQPAARLISSHSFDANSDRATTAELLERPVRITDEEFARALIEASGLQPWNGKLTEAPATPDRMGVKAVVSGGGSEVTVYFASTDAQKAGRVCRISRNRGGMTDAWTSAQDWCASALGLPPLKRVPPVRTANDPIVN